MATEAKKERVLLKTVKNAAGQPLAKIWSDGTINILDVRISYPHIDQMWRKKDSDALAYSASVIVPTKTHQPVIDALLEFCLDMLKTHNKGVDIKDEAYFVRDGKPTKKPEYADAWVVASRETEKPTVLHPDKSEMETPAEIKELIKAGYFVDILIQPWWQDNEHGKRINASLRAVRLRREGPLIKEGGINKNDAISSFDDDDEGGFGGGSSAPADDDDDDGMGGL